MPGLDAANIAFNLLKVVSGSVALGPILLGAAKPAHIVTPSTTVRGLLNMSALAIADTERRGGAAEPASERPKGAPTCTPPDRGEGFDLEPSEGGDHAPHRAIDRGSIATIRNAPMPSSSAAAPTSPVAAFWAGPASAR